MEVCKERILLGRLALLAREGNTTAVCEQLADYFEQQMPGVGTPSNVAAIRGSRKNADTNPLYLGIAELNLDVRIVNMLERGLSIRYVIDLDKWRTDDLLAIPNFGERALTALKRALKEAGVIEALAAKKRLYRADSEGGLVGNRDNHD